MFYNQKFFNKSYLRRYLQKVKLRSESEYFVNPEGNYRLKITNTKNIGKPSFFKFHYCLTRSVALAGFLMVDQMAADQQHDWV